MKLLGKAVPSLSLDFFSITEEWVLGPEQFLTMPDLSFCGVSLSLFQTDCALICSPKRVCQMASGQPTAVSDSYREGLKAFCCSIGGVSAGQMPGVGGLPGGTCSPRETEAPYWSWSYSSLLHESKAMFLPVLTFSLMTQIPRCSRQKCSSSIANNRQLMPLAHQKASTWIKA